MRVLHVISDENIGGAGVLLTSLLHHFNRSEIESIVALPKNSALKDRIRKENACVILLEHHVDRVTAGGIFEMRRLIKSVSPDLVHTNAAVSARIAARLTHVPILHTRHCSFPVNGIWKNRLVRKLGGTWNRMLSDMAVATAEAAKNDLLQLGIPEQKIRVIINGSEPIRELSDAEVQEAQRKWGIRSDDFTVGICARLVPCKGHRTFLDAAKLLCDSLPDMPFRFLIVGDGEERAALEAYAKGVGIGKYVAFTGFVKDMASVYRILRVNVNCSAGTETSCLALSEGMSAGVPCVVSNYGGNPAMIGESEAGFVFPVNDSKSLANLILKIATDPELEKNMKCAALARYRAHYTAKGMADKVSALYREVIKNN